jgi:DNA-binding NtrC family response regulator
MSTRIAVVHDDRGFLHALSKGLLFAGHDVATFADPMPALTALELVGNVKILITRMRFSDSQPVGLSLARVARTARPEVKVLFIAHPDFRSSTLGVGEFMAMPVKSPRW